MYCRLEAVDWITKADVCSKRLPFLESFGNFGQDEGLNSGGFPETLIVGEKKGTFFRQSGCHVDGVGKFVSFLCAEFCRINQNIFGNRN